MTDQHRTTTRAVPSGYDLDPEQNRPDTSAPAPSQLSTGRPSMARDFALLAVTLLALLAFVALGGAWLGLVFGP